MIQNEIQLDIYYTESKPTLSVSGRYLEDPQQAIQRMSFFDGVLTIDASRNLSEEDSENEDNYYYGVVLSPNCTKDVSERWQYLSDNTEIVVMRGNFHEIKPLVFSHFKKLHTIVLPNSLQEICIDNFQGCPNLRFIHLPKYVKSVDGLTANNSLLYIDVAEDNTNFCSVNGYLMSKDKRELVAAPGGLETVVIPDGCEIIGQEALYNTHRKIIVPASVHIIDPLNFYSEVLQEIVLGDYEKQYPLVEACFKSSEYIKRRFKSINIH